jgi:hypothetical protein
MKIFSLNSARSEIGSSFKIIGFLSVYTSLFMLYNLDAQACNMQTGGVVVCNKAGYAISYWQDDCGLLQNQVKFQRSTDAMATWGALRTIDLSNSNLDFNRDHQFEGLFKAVLGEPARTAIIAPIIGVHKNNINGTPLIVLMVSWNCGATWLLHEVKLPNPNGFTFRRITGCPELEVQVQDSGYFVIFSTLTFFNGTKEVGYGCVVSTSDGKNWRVTLTGNGKMPTVCEDDD